jgi:hypothetical protein
MVELFLLGPNVTMDMPQPKFYSNTSTPTSVPRSMDPRRSSVRSASITMGSRPFTFTCIGCKTTNQFNENGRNICSVCRSPAPF